MPSTSSKPSSEPSISSMPSAIPSSSPTSVCSRFTGEESCFRVRCCVWDGSHCFFDPDADGREKPSSNPTTSSKP
eukprot:9795182-Ditylum_brightwellii.AAC.1